MRTAPEVVTTELRKVHLRKKAVIFYDSQVNARRAVKLLFSAVEEARMEKEFEIALFNLESLKNKANFEEAKAQVTAASVALFAVDQLPAEEVLEWVDSWASEITPQASLLVLLANDPAMNPQDHALVCSYFRAVAIRGLRHYNCETCRCHLPPALLPDEEDFPTKALKARTHASIVCMNLPIPLMAF